MSIPFAEEIVLAAEAVRRADALIIGRKGAGMGVDSGLPDFRGSQGFWRAYPPYARLGLDFAAMANPEWFATDPPFAWGFYGHRMNLYRGTLPHEGFGILRRWAAGMARGAFVVTSECLGRPVPTCRLRAGTDHGGPRVDPLDAVCPDVRGRALPGRPVRGPGR